jgi:hypothetical protein
MILLAGLLLVMAYLIFSTQTALLATVGQEAGREATNPLYAEFVGVRAGLAELLEEELTDSNGDVQCPDLLTNWKGRVETMLTMLTQLESNRGQSFHGVYVGGSLDDVTSDTGDELVTEVTLYLSDGDASIHEEIRYYTECID